MINQQPVQGETQPQANQQSQINPQEQEQLDIFVANGMTIIHSQQVSETMLGRVSKSENPIEELSLVLVDIVTRLEKSASENGIKLTNNTLVNGSNALLGELLSVTEAAGMPPFTDEQKTEVFQRATGKFLDDAVKSGSMTKEQLIAQGQQAEQTPEGQKIKQMGGY